MLARDGTQRVLSDCLSLSLFFLLAAWLQPTATFIQINEIHFFLFLILPSERQPFCVWLCVCVCVSYFLCSTTAWSLEFTRGAPGKITEQNQVSHHKKKKGPVVGWMNIHLTVFFLCVFCYWFGWHLLESRASFLIQYNNIGSVLLRFGVCFCSINYEKNLMIFVQWIVNYRLRTMQVEDIRDSKKDDRNRSLLEFSMVNRLNEI